MYRGQYGVCCTPTTQALCPKSTESLAKMHDRYCNVFEAVGLTVSEKNTETVLLRAPTPGTPDLTARHRSSRPRLYGRQTMHFFVPGRFCRCWARDQTPDLTRQGMLQSVQAGAVRYGGCPIHSQDAHAKGRGDGCVAITFG